MNKASSSFSVPVKDITAQNLNHVIDQLKPGEEIRISKLADGSTQFTMRNISGGHASIVPLRNRTVAFLDPMPVSAGWMSHIEEPTEEGVQAHKTREKLAKKVVEKKSGDKSLMKDILDLMVAMADVENSYRIELSMQSYTVFSVMDKIVYCKEVAGEFVPAMYKDDERSPFVYL